jgi:hypothetical protein
MLGVLHGWNKFLVVHVMSAFVIFVALCRSANKLIDWRCQKLDRVFERQGSEAEGDWTSVRNLERETLPKKGIKQESTWSLGIENWCQSMALIPQRNFNRKAEER